MQLFYHQTQTMLIKFKNGKTVFYLCNFYQRWKFDIQLRQFLLNYQTIFSASMHLQFSACHVKASGEIFKWIIIVNLYLYEENKEDVDQQPNRLHGCKEMSTFLFIGCGIFQQKALPTLKCKNVAQITSFVISLFYFC